MNHKRGWRRRVWPVSSTPGGKSTRLGLRMRQHIGACHLYLCVCAIGSQLVEKDELPDRSPVLRSISRARFDPEPFWLLRGEDGGNGVGLHGGGARLLHLGSILGNIEEMAQGQVANRRGLFFQ